MVDSSNPLLFIEPTLASCENAFIVACVSSIATDSEGDYVYLAASVFSLSYTQEQNPEIAFVDIKAIA